MTTRFFVSGSLSEGHVHWSKISIFIESSVPASIRGSAWRLRVGYPVIARDGGDRIEGQLLSVKSSELLLSLLDEFHGFNSLDPLKSLSFREDVLVQTSEGQEHAWTYFINPAKLPSDAERIVQGDWRRSLEEKPSLTSQLTDRQRCYLTRLAAATGREIVPINDLSLYRELMNLGLIVDKGRRLALSNLGRETVRFLE